MRLSERTFEFRCWPGLRAKRLLRDLRHQFTYDGEKAREDVYWLAPYRADLPAKWRGRSRFEIKTRRARLGPIDVWTRDLSEPAPLRAATIERVGRASALLAAALREGASAERAPAGLTSRATRKQRRLYRAGDATIEATRVIWDPRGDRRAAALTIAIEAPSEDGARAALRALRPGGLLNIDYGERIRREREATDAGPRLRAFALWPSVRPRA